MYIFTFAYAFIHMNLYMYKFMCVYMYVYTCVYIWIYNIYEFLYVLNALNMCEYMYIYACVYMNFYMYSKTYSATLFVLMCPWTAIESPKIFLLLFSQWVEPVWVCLCSVVLSVCNVVGVSPWPVGFSAQRRSHCRSARGRGHPPAEGGIGCGPRPKQTLSRSSPRRDPWGSLMFTKKVEANCFGCFFSARDILDKWTGLDPQGCDTYWGQSPKAVQREIAFLGGFGFGSGLL